MFAVCWLNWIFFSVTQIAVKSMKANAVSLVRLVVVSSKSSSLLHRTVTHHIVVEPRRQ